MLRYAGCLVLVVRLRASRRVCCLSWPAVHDKLSAAEQRRKVWVCRQGNGDAVQPCPTSLQCSLLSSTKCPAEAKRPAGLRSYVLSARLFASLA